MRTLVALAAVVVTSALARPAHADPAQATPRAAAPAERPSPAGPPPRADDPPDPTTPPQHAGAPADRAPPQASPALPPLDLSSVPPQCQPLIRPAQSPTVAAALSARISLATCMADRAIAPVALCDCAASIVAIDDAAAPALALLADVVGAGDPVAQVIAEHAEGQLYTGFLHRLLATLPRTAPGASEAELALADMRRQTLEVQLAPWREAALAGFLRAVELAKAHPELARIPAVASVVRDAEQHLASGVAAR